MSLQLLEKPPSAGTTTPTMLTGFGWQALEDALHERKKLSEFSHIWLTPEDYARAHKTFSVLTAPDLRIQFMMLERGGRLVQSCPTTPWPQDGSTWH